MSFTSATLFSIHQILAARVPELAITEDEASKLAEAVNNFQNAFDVKIDPKTQAVINLCLVGGSIYGTRAIGIVARIRAERATVVNEPNSVS